MKKILSLLMCIAFIMICVNQASAKVEPVKSFPTDIVFCQVDHTSNVFVQQNVFNPYLLTQPVIKKPILVSIDGNRDYLTNHLLCPAFYRPYNLLKFKNDLCLFNKQGLLYRFDKHGPAKPIILNLKICPLHKYQV